MGYLTKDRVFVSDLTATELAEYKLRASWLAERHFSSKVIEAFDLGNLPSGYMTAEISTSYQPGKRRVWVYVDKQLVQTIRCDAGQGARRVAQDYYSAAVNHSRRLVVV